MPSLSRSPNITAKDPPVVVEPASSNTSSPRPESEAGDVDGHQASQDRYLAQSMIESTTAATRTRSNTLLGRGGAGVEATVGEQPERERDLGTTPHRSGTGATAGPSTSGAGIRQISNLSGTSPPRVEVASSAGRRRGSISAVNPLEHLADDLEIQSHQQDQLLMDFYDRGNSPDHRVGAIPSERMRSFQQHHATPSPAAVRFYQHNRNPSESSIDSQGGAFIDHRRQPHSLVMGSASRSVPNNSRPSNFGRSSNDFISRSSASRSDALRRQVSSDNAARGDGNGDFVPYRDDDDDPPSPSRGPRHEAEQSGFTVRAGRSRPPAGFGSSGGRDRDNDDDISDDDLLPRAHLERHDSHTSYRSQRSRDRMEEPHSGSFSNEHSRRGSMLNGEPPEEDVCFPAHGATIGDVDLLDLGMGYNYPETGDAHAHDGLPGVLHNFPFPFDFSALEEFAEREKEGVPIPGARKRAGTQGEALSPPGFGTSLRSRLGLSSSSDNETNRRAFRQRKLSQSIAPSRFQRNLAPFEGSGADDMPPPPGLRQGFPASILDTKTPLLAEPNKAQSGGTGVGGVYGSSTGRAGPGRSGGPSGAARPYRFSFYSNALPSTIHARSLAELPAEGQTFEELFIGRRPSPEEETMSGVGSLPSQFGGTGAGTGANTPNNGGGTTGSNRTSLQGGVNVGARPAGVASALGSAKRSEAVKSQLIRSDVDAEANTWWLDVMCPTDQEMKVLSKVFSIHPLTTEDIQMEETREKTELFRNYYFVCFRSFEQDPYSPTYLEPLNMYIIVFREGTISFHFRGTPHPQNVRRRIKQLKDYINVTSDWISYALIDDITDAFGPLIQNIEYEVDSIDELVLILKEAEQSDMLRRIGMCRKKVMGLLRLMGNKVDVVKGLAKRCNENWSVAPKSDIGLYLSDIQDHITTSTQNLTHYEKILSRSHSNYLAQISIEMTDANNQINDVLSKLTALGTVLIPMNLITGLWGMNVQVPGQGDLPGNDNLHWFLGIIGCLCAIAFGGALLTYKVFVRS